MSGHSLRRSRGCSRASHGSIDSVLEDGRLSPVPVQLARLRGGGRGLCRCGVAALGEGCGGLAGFEMRRARGAHVSRWHVRDGVGAGCAAGRRV